jgi:RNA polymerase sigma-70 factor, ECF subfamily
MSVVRTQASGADEAGDEGISSVAEPAPESESPSKASSLPPAMPVNSGRATASNQKQQRLKEAEEDRALITRAQGGDSAAFRHLVERHQRRAFAIALSLVRDENDARELVQDAFLRVFKGLATFQGGSSFFTWLYRIITNLSIDLIRKPGHRTTEMDDARLDTEEAHDQDAPFLSRFEGADPMELVRRREIGGRLQAALDALPSYHRAVVVMREVEGLSYEEMAQVMGVSKGTIMSRLFHARQKLQRALVDCYKEQVGGAPPKGDTDDPGAVSSGSSGEGET